MVDVWNGFHLPAREWLDVPFGLGGWFLKAGAFRGSWTLVAMYRHIYIYICIYNCIYIPRPSKGKFNFDIRKH